MMTDAKKSKKSNTNVWGGLCREFDEEMDREIDMGMDRDTDMRKLNMDRW